jgi:hypothetical protein
MGYTGARKAGGKEVSSRNSSIEELTGHEKRETLMFV